VFIRNGKAVKGLTVVDEADPAFAPQRHKFEDKPVDESEVKAQDKNTADASIIALMQPGATRDQMIAKFKELSGGVEPPKGITKSELREVFTAMAIDGDTFQNAAAEIMSAATPGK
jgi:hypothetical protein